MARTTRTRPPTAAFSSMTTSFSWPMLGGKRSSSSSPRAARARFGTVSSTRSTRQNRRRRAHHLPGARSQSVRGPWLFCEAPGVRVSPVRHRCAGYARIVGSSDAETASSSEPHRPGLHIRTGTFEPAHSNQSTFEPAHSSENEVGSTFSPTSGMLSPSVSCAYCWHGTQKPSHRSLGSRLGKVDR